MTTISFDTVTSESVYAILLCEEGGFLYYTGKFGIEWTTRGDLSIFTDKATVFDKVSAEPTWDDICGSVVFLNESELREIIAD